MRNRDHGKRSERVSRRYGGDVFRNGDTRLFGFEECRTMTGQTMKYEIEVAPNGGVVVKDTYGNMLAAFAGIVSAASWIGKRPTTVAGDDGWIPHDGGSCPVADDVRVDIKTGGLGISEDAPAGFWCGGDDWWRHEGSTSSNIIAYRVVSS